MPKVVDHEQRRAEIGAAVQRLVAREGAEAVSIRTVAAESGWSTGALRHYFATKAELLAFTAELVAERVAARLRERMERGFGGRTRCAAARELIGEVLPFDAERSTEAAISFAFLDLARVDPGVAEQQRRHFDELRAFLRDVVEHLAGGGAQDVEVSARRLHLLVDGLSLHLLFGRIGEAEVRAELDRELAAIASG
ncbi:TetR/AcrR family transcriptional regulator [Salinifilum ghardaiensis]